MRRNGRFDAVSPLTEPLSDGVRNFAERRVGGMVEEFNWQQTFRPSTTRSGKFSEAPHSCGLL